MNYRIEAKASFEVFGIEQLFNSNENEQNGHTPANFWRENHENGEVKRLEQCAGNLPPFLNSNAYKVHALCSYKETDDNSFPYMICAFRSDTSDVKSYSVVNIPAHTWAIFPTEPFTWAEFSSVIDTLYKRIYSEWLPSSGYKLVNGMEFEICGEREGLPFLELWFAVHKA